MDKRDKEIHDIKKMGLRIKDLRKARNMTQAEFSEKIQVSVNAVAAYERGINYPALEIGLKISQLFHVSMDWLFAAEPAYLKKNRNDRTTCAQVASKLIELHEMIYFSLRDEKPEKGGTKTYIEFSDNPTLEHVVKFIKDWETMRAIHKQGTISNELFQTWQKEQMAKLSDINLE